MQAMGQGFDTEYKPNPELVPIYEMRYKKYKLVVLSLKDRP
jgi:L-ribulokinase